MKKLKTILMNIAKKSLIFRKISRYVLYIFRRLRYAIRGFGQDVNKKMIIFSTFNGKSYSDSPKAIYEYMIKSGKYNDYIYVWAFIEPNKYKYLEQNENTILVKQGTKEYEKYMSKAKYWIFNYKIGDFLKPKTDQIFLQCWHGTPLKRLGCDLKHYDNQLNTEEEMEKRYTMEAKKFSYFLSPSKYSTEKFISAWNLKGLHKENIIIEEGYPRNDFLYNYKQEDVIRIKEKILGNGNKNTNKKIVLYAPTYRANNHKSGLGYIYKEEVDFDKMKEELGDEYIILFRPHYFIANTFNFEKYKGFVYNVSDIDDINELYIIADMLITDYSSVFFDYANLKRPIIFYMYDLEYYRDKSNGFYIDINEELPGEIVKTSDDLINKIIIMGNDFIYDEKYKKFNEKYNYLDDGEASKRVVERILE